jgi:hypothetical protein
MLGHSASVKTNSKEQSYVPLEEPIVCWLIQKCSAFFPVVYESIYFFSLALQHPWAVASDFQFFDHFTDGRILWTSDQFVARSLPKHMTIQTQNKHIHTPSMSCVGFEPTIPASERAKTVHALDHSATVTGITVSKTVKFKRISIRHKVYMPIFSESRDSVVGIGDWVRAGRPRGRSSSLGRVKNFVLHVVQTGSGVQPVSYPMCTGGSFSGGKEVGA